MVNSHKFIKLLISWKFTETFSFVGACTIDGFDIIDLPTWSKFELIYIYQTKFPFCLSNILRKS